MIAWFASDECSFSTGAVFDLSGGRATYRPRVYRNQKIIEYPMNFALDDQQRLLISTVRAFIKSELAPLEDEIEKTGVLCPELAKSVHAKAKALGLYAMNIPEQFGGGGLSAVDQMLVEEQFGYTTDILIRRAFGNVYEMLLECRDAQIGRFRDLAGRASTLPPHPIVEEYMRTLGEVEAI